jgi:hypothetical protein
MPESAPHLWSSTTRLRSRAGGVLLAASLGVLAFTGSAAAQVGQQYQPTTVTVTTTVTTPDDRGGTPTITTTPTTPTTPDDRGGDTGGDDDGRTDDGGTGDGTGNGTGSGTGNGTARGAGVANGSAGAPIAARPIVFASFGIIPREVRDDVERALREGGIFYRFVEVDRERLDAFLESDLARRIAGSESPRAIGRATAEALSEDGADADAVREALFPDAPDDITPLIAAVLAYGPKETTAHRRFLHGVGVGLRREEVPGVFVERRDTKPSHIDEFEKRRVPVVDDIDTRAGRERLVRLLLRQAPETADYAPVPVSATASPASFVKGDGSSPTGVIAAGGLALLAIVMLSGNAIVRRFRHS